MKIIFKILFLFALLFIISCKKYPDGPLLSLHSKEHRIAGSNNKKWDVSYFSINGYDSTSYLKNQSGYGKYQFEREKDGRAVFVCLSTDLVYGIGGYWKFSNHKNNIQVNAHSLNAMHFNLGPYAADDQSWVIQRLTETDLWLKCTYNNKEYFVKFIN